MKNEISRGGFKLALIISLILLGLTTIQAASQELYKEKTFNVNSGETLRMEVLGGDILIAAWDKNEVHVKVYANDNAQEKLDFTLEKTSDGVFIKSEKKGSLSWGWNNISTKYEIKAPKEFLLDLKTSGGDIKVEKIDGKKLVKTSGGDIEIFDASGNLDAKTSGGDVTISNLKGDVELSTSGGDIKVTGTLGNVEAATSGGDIELNKTNGKVNAKTSGGDIKVYHNGENNGMELYSSGGDIEIKFSGTVKADLDLYTTGGKVKCGLSGLKIKEMKSNYLEGTVNGGGSLIKAKTTGGDVEVN